MRQAGPDYVHLFYRFPLVPLADEPERAEAQAMRDWLDTRTELSPSALDYQAVLDMLLIDYAVRKLDEPDTEPAPPPEADPDDEGTETPSHEDAPVITRARRKK